MKIAIHHNPNSFSDRWIAYCKSNSIDYKIVNCYDSDIIQQLTDCDALMWHFNNYYYRDMLMARQVLFSIQKMGKKVFPDINTSWHFDDKVGQKYLLESINAPLVPSFVFYDKASALSWARNTTYPKVFKLRGGSGSRNVKLAKTKTSAVSLIRKAFRSGFSQFDRFGHIKERIRRYRIGKDSIIGILKGLVWFFISSEYARMHGKEKGYVYFQDFIPDNKYDIRIIVIGEKAFALKRMTRENDFRASGSGHIIYDKLEIDERCVQIAFEINKKIKAQSIAYDFVFDKDNQPLIVEISYGYDVMAYDKCPGYWDSRLNWHEGKFNPQEWIIEDLISTIK